MWTQLGTVGLGVWLTAAPEVLGLPPAAARNFHVVGPLVAMFGVLAVFEILRPVRWVNALFGVWLVLAPFVLGYGGVALANSAVVGVALVALASIRGVVRETFGGGWRVLWDPAADPVQQGGTT